VKTFFAIATFALMNFGVYAQTNSSAASPKSRVTHIDSDRADFDLNARTAIYRGNVRVSDPEMKMTCEWLVADLPQSGHINRIVAETNVVIDYTDSKNQVTHATGEKAIYNYSVQKGVTNETVTLTGNPVVNNPQFHMVADPLVWDRIHNVFSAKNQHGTIQNWTSAGSTNSPAITNQNSMPKTNSPGTIENIDKVLPPQNTP